MEGEKKVTKSARAMFCYSSWNGEDLIAVRQVVSYKVLCFESSRKCRSSAGEAARHRLQRRSRPARRWEENTATNSHSRVSEQPQNRPMLEGQAPRLPPLSAEHHPSAAFTF